MLDLVSELHKLVESSKEMESWVGKCVEKYNHECVFFPDAFDQLCTYSQMNMECYYKMVVIDENFREELLIDFFSKYLDIGESNSVDSSISQFTNIETHHDILGRDELKQLIEKYIKIIGDTFFVHHDIAEIIIKHYRYDIEKATQGFLEKPETVLNGYSIQHEEISQPLGLRRATTDQECDICAEPCSASQLLSLQCGHSFCENCWKEHLMSSVSRGTLFIKCPSGCNAVVLQRDVFLICGETIGNDYVSFILDSFVQDCLIVKRCHNPKCNKVLSYSTLGYCGAAECECGCQTCWFCSEEAHPPLTCRQKSKWLELTSSDAIANKWLSQNTKVCPKCRIRIEKNGGCNHMTCQRCHYEFCWICGGDWLQHTDYYRCAQFTNEIDQNRKYAQYDDVQRLNHYHQRYETHMRSRQEINNSSKRLYNNRIRNMLKEKCSINDIESISSLIVQTIDHALILLAWSYAYASFLPIDSTKLKLFEYVLVDLEVSFNQISDTIENSKTFSYQSIELLLKLLQNKIVVVLKHVESVHK